MKDQKAPKQKSSSYLIVKDYILAFPIIFFAFFLILSYSNYWPVSVSIFKDFFVLKKLQPFDPTVFLKHLKNIFYIILMIISVKGFGDFIISKIKLNTDLEIENVFAFGFGFAFLILITFFIGSFGFLYKLPILILLILGIILFFYCYPKRLKVWQLGASPISAISQFFCPTYIDDGTRINKQNSLSKQKFSILEIIYLFLIIVTIFYMLPCVLVPETFYDSLLSNLGVPFKWLQMHKIQSIPYNIYSDVPYNIGILYAINLMFSDTSLAQLMNLTFFVLTSWAVFVFAKKYSNRIFGIFAATFYALTPLLFMLSTRTGFEVGLTFFELLSVFAIVRYFIDKENYPLKWLIIAGIMNGIALGGKYTSVVSTFAIICSLLALDKQRFKSILIFGFAAAIIASPWYIRNFVNWGNPFVPLADFLGQSDTIRIHGIMGLSKVAWTWKKILLLPWYLITERIQLESYIGFAYIFIFPLLFLLRKIKKEMKFLNIYVLVYLVVGIIVDRAYLRYLSPVFAAVAVLYALYIFHVNSKSVRMLFMVFCIPIFILNLSTSLVIAKLNYNPISNVLGFVSDHKYLNSMRPSYPNPYFEAADWINKNTKKDAKVLVAGDSRSLYIERENISANTRNKTPLVEFVKIAKDEKDLREIFRELGITHILFSPPEFIRLASREMLYWNKRDLDLYSEFFDLYLKEVYRSIPDYELRNNRLLSEYDARWKKYISSALNYVYVYEIVDFVNPDERRPDTFNLFLVKNLYSDQKADELLGD